MVSGMVLVTLIGVNLQQGSNAMHQPLTAPFQEQVLQQIIYNPMVINITVKSHPCTRLVTSLHNIKSTSHPFHMIRTLKELTLSSYTPPLPI